jgi:putative metallohydrolase (TIGR04338 family)
MTTRAAARAAADPDASSVYAAETAATANAALRRYRRFRDLVAHVDAITTSTWWDATFPDAPIDVTVARRSHTATYSFAQQSSWDREHAAIAIVDGRHWDAGVVLHELAHIAAGHDAGHGPVFRSALIALWRREAGIHAAVELVDQLRAAGFPVDLTDA